MNKADIDNRFAFHAATTEEKRNEHTSVRESCARLARFLNTRLPDGREKSLAITKLEECMFWSNAAIARPPFDVVLQRVVKLDGETTE